MKRLVLDEDVTCVALNVGPHDDGPCFDEAVLVVGGLDTVDAHELLNYVEYYDFDIYTKGNYKPIEKALKALLESAGFMWEVERTSEDMYEDDTKYYHKTLCFSIERSENG